MPGFRSALNNLTAGLLPCYQDWQRFSGESFAPGVQDLASQVIQQYYREGYEQRSTLDTIEPLDISKKKDSNEEIWRLVAEFCGFTGRQGKVWFPDLSPSKNVDEIFSMVPRWVLRSPFPLSRLPFIQPYSYPNKKLNKFIKHLKRKFEVVTISGAKHPAFVFHDGSKFPIHLAREISYQTILLNRLQKN